MQCNEMPHEWVKQKWTGRVLNEWKGILNARFDEMFLNLNFVMWVQYFRGFLFLLRGLFFWCQQIKEKSKISYGRLEERDGFVE